MDQGEHVQGPKKKRRASLFRKGWNDTFEPGSVTINDQKNTCIQWKCMPYDIDTGYTTLSSVLFDLCIKDTSLPRTGTNI